MTNLSAEAAIQRFKENEERVDKFVNETGEYQTNKSPSQGVQTLPSFMAEMISRHLTYNVKGDWTTATIYAVQDLVFSSGVTYVCLLAHTSGTFATDLAAGKWAIYQGATKAELAAADGAEMVGHSYSEAPAYLKTLSDIANGDEVSVHRWMTQAEINDGLSGTPVGDHSAAFQDAFSSYSKLTLQRGKYRITSAVSMNLDDADINFGSSIIVADFAGSGFVFNFGASSDTPVRTGLRVKGGRFVQANPAGVQNTNFIRIAGTQDFEICGQILNNVANGGITVEAGCELGDIHHITINGKNGYSTVRGIWLQGSTASDYASQLIDTDSITRNAIAIPTYATKDVRIHHNRIKVPAYGIYLMNTRDCSVEDNFIDISGVGATRCISLNNYSPGARVSRNTLVSDRSSTGVLITQASDSVIIDENRFKGSFGGNRDIYVAYRAEALITNNRFDTDSTQNIQIDMGGFAVIKNNRFTKGARTADYRCVYMTPIDGVQAGGTVGSTATVLPGVVFKDNEVRRRCIGVFADCSSFAASNGNLPAFDMINVKNNVFFEMNLAATPSEYPLLLTTGTSSNITRFSYSGNEVFPNTAAHRNVPNANGSAYYAEKTEAYLGAFLVNVAVSGGAITVTKLAGANYGLSASRSGANLVLSPRTIEGAASASVAPVFQICDEGGTIYRYSLIKSGTNYVLSIYDAANAQISFATASASFKILVGAMPNT